VSCERVFALKTTVVKRIGFMASHYYWCDEFSEEENWAVFKDCANRHGHGHNYQVEVSVEGPVDPKTGMVINFYDLDPILHRAILAPMDHKFLNAQVPFFSTHVPTLENIARFIWDRLAPDIAAQHMVLQKIKVIEHPGLFVEYDGNLEGQPA
jgi:6-pyruvoyltetrahydropterin/6-carboxytetrahydropterin synthase